ncbi:hypothetical protein TNCV_2961201 [Trichonephila clavipes]|nr:hypothetical protein TNCV_2961201 [Trichonephila clavipes]
MLPVLGKKAVLEWCTKEGLIGSSYACPKRRKRMELRERTVQFSLECDTRYVLIWRKRGSRNRHSFVRERLQDRQEGLIVWVEISIGGVRNHKLFGMASQKNKRYTNEILSPYFVPYVAVIGNYFLLKQNNARSHATLLVENILEVETI